MHYALLILYVIVLCVELSLVPPIQLGETVWVYGAVHTTATGKIVAGSATTPLLISNRPPYQLRRVYGVQWMGASALLLTALLMMTLLLWVSW